MQQPRFVSAWFIRTFSPLRGEKVRKRRTFIKSWGATSAEIDEGLCSFDQTFLLATVPVLLYFVFAQTNAQPFCQITENKDRENICENQPYHKPQTQRSDPQGCADIIAQKDHQRVQKIDCIAVSVDALP